MTIEITVVGRVRDVNAYTRLARQMTDLALTEEGTLRYDWCLSDDGECRNTDVYRDNESFLYHFRRASSLELVASYVEIVEIDRMDVLGSVTDEVEAALEQFRPTYLTAVSSLG